jgi:hypothetical protein
MKTKAAHFTSPPLPGVIKLYFRLIRWLLEQRVAAARNAPEKTSNSKLTIQG